MGYLQPNHVSHFFKFDSDINNDKKERQYCI